LILIEEVTGFDLEKNFFDFTKLFYITFILSDDFKYTLINIVRFPEVLALEDLLEYLF